VRWCEDGAIVVGLAVMKSGIPDPEALFVFKREGICFYVDPEDDDVEGWMVLSLMGTTSYDSCEECGDDTTHTFPCPCSNFTGLAAQYTVSFRFQVWEPNANDNWDDWGDPGELGALLFDGRLAAVVAQTGACNWRISDPFPAYPWFNRIEMFWDTQNCCWTISTVLLAQFTKCVGTTPNGGPYQNNPANGYLRPQRVGTPARFYLITDVVVSP
jgi:hypothetical protein